MRFGEQALLFDRAAAAFAAKRLRRQIGALEPQLCQLRLATAGLERPLGAKFRLVTPGGERQSQESRGEFPMAQQGCRAAEKLEHGLSPYFRTGSGIRAP